MKKILLITVLAIILTGCSSKTDYSMSDQNKDNSVTENTTSEEISSDNNEISKIENEKRVKDTTKSDSSEQNEEMGLFKVSCDYPKEIEPQEGDEFVLYYKINGNDKLEYVSINAYEYNEHFQEVNLPLGEIMIVGIVYTGHNPLIADDVYAVPIIIPIRREDEVYVLTNIIIGEDNVSRSMQGGQTQYVLNGERVVEADDNYAKIEQASPDDFIKELMEN